MFLTVCELNQVTILTFCATQTLFWRNLQMAEQQLLVFLGYFWTNILVLPVNRRRSKTSSYFSRISSKLINFTEDEYIKGFVAALEIKLEKKSFEKLCPLLWSKPIEKKILCWSKILALVKAISDIDACDDCDHINTKWYFIYKCWNHCTLQMLLEGWQWNKVLILTKNSNKKRKLHHLSNF